MTRFPDTPWRNPDGRLTSYVGPDGWTHSPPADELKLAAALADLAEYRRSAALTRPGSVSQPPRCGGDWLRRRLAVAANCGSRQAPVTEPREPDFDAPKFVVRPDGAVSVSAGEIDVRAAAGILRLGEERVRQLIQAGVIAGRKTDRNYWLVNGGDVAREAEKRWRERGGGGGIRRPGGDAGALAG